MERTLPSEYSIDKMTEAEAHTLGRWAAEEGWNPGIHDIAIAWTYDPDAFIALRRGEELVGGGAIIVYGKSVGFMGLFIVRADMRKQGLGTVLWWERLRRLQARLEPDASIGMDGVFEMVPFYAKGGFELLYKDVRYDGIAHGGMDPAAQPLDAVPFEQIVAFDTAHFATNRAKFLEAWIAAPEGNGVALVENGELLGYGFVRKCLTGYKTGPAYAKGPENGKRLLQSLFSLIPGEQVQVDVPETNGPAVAMLESWGFTQSFGCARMTHGPAPAVPVADVFGITSFEFG